MNAKRIFLALSLVIGVVISTTSLKANTDESHGRQLVGTWAVTVTPVPAPGAPPLPDRFLYLTFAQGGTLIGSDRGLPFASPQHGVWERQGRRQFLYITVQDLFDAAGNFQGTLKVKSSITMTGPNEFVAVSNPQIRNAAGVLILDACSTSKGRRIETEPLLERCQNITPPQ